MSIKKEILFRAGIIYFCFLLLGFVIIGRIIFLQFVQGPKYREKAKAITLKDITISPNRGDILATDGRLLASSIPFYEIRMDLKARGLEKEVFQENLDSLSLCLSKLFKDKSSNAYKKDMQQAYKEGRRFYLVRRKVDFNQLKTLKTFPLFRLGKNKSGMIAMQENVRFQPHQSLASRTIGYLSKSDAGNVVGIEGGFDQYLRGVKGVRLMQRLSGGVWMPVNDDNEVDPQDGNDVVSTLDVNIQDVAENALRKQLQSHNAHHGCAVLMEVSTGEIKAITNLERDANGNYRETYNYAIGETTEPGSTFKLASLMAAFEDGYIQLSDTVNTGDGTVSYYEKQMKDSEDKGLGKITVKQVFEHSSNVGVSKIITKYYTGKERQFIDRIYGMKLNQKLNLEIRGEGTPEIKYPGDKHWSGISLPWMSIGYEVKLAPIHTLTLYNAIANDGKMVKPRFVKAILYHGKTVKTFGPDVIESSICSNSTLEKVKEMLEGVVEEGTAKNLSMPNCKVKIAGKTGTAQIAKQKFGYKSEDGISYQASFVGYFPADNPKYSCIVVVNSPSNSEYYGASVAGPVFKEIAEKVYATSLAMHPVLKPGKSPVDIPVSKAGKKQDLSYIFDKLDIEVTGNKNRTEWVTTSKKDKDVAFTSRTVTPSLVPNVVDMGLRDALFLLENAGLKVVVKGRGRITAQSIMPGTRIKTGETIYLTLSLG
ncbi:MAG: penicillin-binding protein [Bacteroidota bacterium]|nr:penicillin-binding protein [Bacteroidota bacterium]